MRKLAIALVTLGAAVTFGCSTMTIGSSCGRPLRESRRSTRSLVAGWDLRSDGCGTRRVGTGNMRSSQKCPV